MDDLTEHQFEIYTVELPSEYVEQIYSQSIPKKRFETVNRYTSSVLGVDVFGEARDFQTLVRSADGGVVLQFLRHLGVLQAANLDSEQIAALENSGARVVKNELIEFDVERQGSEKEFANILEAAKAAEHDAVAEGLFPTANLNANEYNALEQALLSINWYSKMNFSRKARKSKTNWEPASGFPNGIPWHLESTNVSLAKSKYPKLGANDIVVAVVDFGVDTRHFCFEDTKFLHYRAFYSNGRDSDIDDPLKRRDFHVSSHGTAVASLISGKYVGMVPNASMIVAALKPRSFFSENPTCDSGQLLRSLNWISAKVLELVKDGRVVLPIINLSFSLGSGVLREVEASIIRLVEEIGVCAVAAAGNGTGQIKFPAHLPVCQAIASHDRYDVASEFNCLGSRSLDYILAPGEDVVAAFAAHGLLGTRYGFRPKSGTSYAAALASGAAVVVAPQNTDRRSDDKLGTAVRQVNGHRILDLSN